MKEDFIMKLSDKILSLRKQHGMSQEQLAEKLNVSRQTISRWEVGSAQPDASNVLQLSKLFGVTADYLLNDGYESDHDVPVVKNTEAAAKNKVKKVIALCATAFGLFGNFIIYILSRFIDVIIPYPVYDNNKIIFYEYSSDHTGYSYKHFVQEHNMEFLTILFWGLFFAGLIYFCSKNDKIKKVVTKYKEKKLQITGTNNLEK